MVFYATCTSLHLAGPVQGCLSLELHKIFVIRPVQACVSAETHKGSSFLQEHEYVISLVRPAVKPLLAGHLADIETKLKPGLHILTWTSLNIDGYLHHLHQVFRQLARCMIASRSRMALLLIERQSQARFVNQRDK